MKYLIPAVVAILVAARLWRRRTRRTSGPGADVALVRSRVRRPLGSIEGLGGDVGLVAAREIRDRVRGRLFRVGTLIILLAVAAAVVIPTIKSHAHENTRVGVVGGLTHAQRGVVVASGRAVGTWVTLVPERSLRNADAALRSGGLSLVVVGARQVVTDQAVAASATSTTALLARAVAASLGLANGLTHAGVSGGALLPVLESRPLPIHSLQPATHNSTARTTALYGLILTYVLLTQYGTWLLMGVIEEKSSRVIEVLLSTLRPSQLLAGKVIGIGTVAFVQSALVVGVALGVGAAVGSTLLHGSTPLDVLAILVWLVLGYAFYCWVWAAGGSLAERQSQVQSLAFPLQLPILFGYIVSLTAVASGNASMLVKVLAYVPPTAPFAMPALVALGQATWWEVVVSAVITIAATVLVARLATAVYYRAILQTGGRVRLRQVISGSRSTRVEPVAG